MPPEKPTVNQLTPFTLDDVIDGKRARCEGCWASQLYGNFACLRIGFGYFELCVQCFDELTTEAAKLWHKYKLDRFRDDG